MTNEIDLTPREQDILKLLCEGLSNRAIANKLVLSVGTVKWYNKQIFAKLNVNSRTQAVLIAHEKSIVTTSDTISSQANHIPNPITSFIGRKQALQQLASLVPQHRLISIVGPGGVGKTRLAIQLAHHDTLPVSHQIVFVPLAPVSNGDQISYAIANAMGLSIRDVATINQQIIQLISHSPTLLILDNFEHLLTANPLLDTLLRSVATLHIVVTSRERLHLTGELVFPLAGLATSSSNEVLAIDGNEAVDLFLNRTQYSDIHFQPTDDQLTQIADICRLLDGTPLAIEHVASWMHVLDLLTIKSELQRSLDILQTSAHNVAERHRSMRAVINRSWERLMPDEQQALMRLAVFRGGFQRDGADFVAGATLLILSALVKKSFVYRVSEDRYDIHELQRQFALEKLEEQGATAKTKSQYAHFYADLVDAICVKRYEFAEYNVAGLDQLDAEYDNIREAILWSLYEGEPCVALRILAEGKLFFSDRGHHVEGGQWILEALTRCINPELSIRVKAYLMQGFVGRLANPQKLFLQNRSEYLVWAERTENPEYLAKTHMMLARQALSEKDLDAAQYHAEGGLQIFKANQDQFPGSYGVFLHELSKIFFAKGELNRAIDTVKESCDIWRAFNGRFVGRLVQLIQWLRLVGKNENIAELLQEALDNALYLASPIWSMSCLHETASYLHEQGNLIESVQLTASAWRTYNQTQFPIGEDLQLLIDKLRHDVDPATFDTLWAQGLSFSTNTAIGLAQDTLEILS